MNAPAKPTHVSLFAGVGMTDYAADLEGFETLATAEIDPWNRKVLARRFPAAAHYDDVKKVTSDALRRDTGFLGRVDLLSGGFPCQDISAMGTGLGLNGARSGLWSEFLRIIRELGPNYVLAENSNMLRSRGLKVILLDLWMAGYDVRWECIPAAYVNAPHMRDRIWIMARRVDTVGGYKLPSAKKSKWLGNVWSESSMTSVAFARLPRAGGMVTGQVYELEPLTTVKDARKALLAHDARCPATPTGAWPTPAASLPQDGERDPQGWLARRETLKAKGINGNGAGMPLSIAVRLFPTPRAAANEWRTTRNAPTHGNGHGKTLAGELNDLERAAGRQPAKPSDSAGNVNAEWVEWLMGTPLGWTDPDVPNALLKPHPGFPYEPTWIPRTAGNVADRKARLRALGNGLVPHVARVAIRILIND